MIETLKLKCFLLSFNFPDTDKSAADQSTASSWWRQHLTQPETPSNFYSATHGLVQTHPSLSSGIPRPLGASPSPIAAGSTARPLGGAKTKSGFPSVVNPNPRSPFRHLDFSTSATAELRRNPNLSAPDECARACREGEPPRICYYHFTLEYYTVLGA